MPKGLRVARSYALKNTMFSFPLDSIRSDRQPGLDNAPVVFHGVNKSGSLTMASVLRNSFALRKEDDRFMCRYMSIPDTREEAIRRMVGDEGRNRMLIDHALVGMEKQVPGARMITMLRHPIRRAISAYYWHQSRHPEKVMGRDLLNWVRMEGKQHSQVRQFAFDHFSKRERNAIRNRGIAEIVNLAMAYFDDNIAWYGITEMFDESVLSLHWELGFDRVGADISDTRNKDRPAYLHRDITDGEFGAANMTISRAYYDELEQLLGFDIVFYEMMKRRFRKYLAGFEMDAALQAYREAKA